MPPPTRLIIITDGRGGLRNLDFFAAAAAAAVTPASSLQHCILRELMGSCLGASGRHYFAFLSAAYRPIATQTSSVFIRFHCINVVDFFFLLVAVYFLNDLFVIYKQDKCSWSGTPEMNDRC